MDHKDTTTELKGKQHLPAELLSPLSPPLDFFSTPAVASASPPSLVCAESNKKKIETIKTAHILVAESPAGAECDSKTKIRPRKQPKRNNQTAHVCTAEISERSCAGQTTNKIWPRIRTEKNGAN